MNQVPENARRSEHGRIPNEREIRGARLRHRVTEAREAASDLRGKAELAIREQPLLVPLAACAVGLGVGVLIGSRLTRVLLFAVVGGLVSDALGGELKRFSRDFIEDLQRRWATDAGHGEPDVLG